MRQLREILARLGGVFLRRRRDRDLEAELRFHLQMEEEAGIGRGLSRKEALRQAHLRAGTVPAAMDHLREQRGLPWLEGTAADLRQAAAALVRHRGFAGIAGTALALAVATNTLIFSLVNGVILQPLPYPQPNRLVRVFESTRRNPKWPVSLGNFLELQRNNRTLESAALYTGQDLELMHGEQAERLRAVRITAGFFRTLGVEPMLGRDFTEAETRGVAKVAILSNRLWKTRFHADPDIVGKAIRLNRESWMVVGVLPPGFQHVGGAYRSPLQGDSVALWCPLQMDLPEGGLRNWHFTNLVARMKPGVSIERSREDFRRMAGELRTRFPGPNSGLELRVIPLAAEVVGDSSQTVWLLTAAGGLVLLIACANVAGLCVARGLARRREMAVRQALGAGTWRLVRAALAENLVLGVAGGVAGLALAAALFPAWRALLPPDFPRVHEVSLTFLSAFFAVTCALATSLVAGVLPAFRQSSADPVDHLNQQSRTASPGREAGRLRAILVTGEVAFAAVLSIAAALLAHSSLRLSERPQGFDARSVLTFTLSLPRTGYSKPAQLNRFYDEVTSRWRALPGVRAAGLGVDVPWTGYDENTSFGIPGLREEGTGGPQARFHMASVGYFETLRIPLRAGRTFDQRDREGSPRVVVINESLARRYLPGENPLGRILDIWGDKWQVVGVVADVFDHPSDAKAEPAFWFPLAQQEQGQLVAVVRTDGDPLSLAGAAAGAVRAIDPELPLAEVRPMDDIARLALGERNLANRLIQTFAGLALLLAVSGIYGLLSYVVEQRHREFGIRMALGATRGSVAWLVLKGGLKQAGAGAILGILLAPAAGRALSSLLYGVTPFDWVPLLVAAVLIPAASLAASLIPAAVAARAEPAGTLRAE